MRHFSVVVALRLTWMLVATRAAFVVAWLATAIAALAVAATPRRYCGLISTPSAALVSRYALAVAGVSLVAAFVCAAAGSFSIRRSAFGIFFASAAAWVVVAVLVSQYPDSGATCP
jgi:hypothetical protein